MENNKNDIFLVDSENIADHEDLKESLKYLVEEDLLNNTSNYDIIKSDLEYLEIINKGKLNTKEIINELNGYNMEIINLNNLVGDLTKLKSYLINNKTFCENNNIYIVSELINVIEIINKIIDKKMIGGGKND